MVLAVAATVVFAGAALQSLTGFGFAVAAAPGLVLLLGAHDAVPLVLVLGAALNALALARAADRRAVARRDAALLLASALPGLAAGAVLFAHLGERALAACVCAGVLVAVAARVRAPATVSPPPRAALPLAGLAAGALTTTTGTNGPPVALYLLHTGAGPARLRATLAVVFLGLAAIGIALLAAGGDLALRPLDAALLPAVLCGHASGRQMARRWDGTPVVERVALATLAVAALAAGAAAF